MDVDRGDRAHRSTSGFVDGVDESKEQETTVNLSFQGRFKRPGHRMILDVVVL